MRPLVCEFRVNMLETALNVNHLRAKLSVSNFKIGKFYLILNESCERIRFNRDQSRRWDRETTGNLQLGLIATASENVAGELILEYDSDDDRLHNEARHLGQAPYVVGQ